MTRTMRLALPDVRDPDQAGRLLANMPDGCTCYVAVDAGTRYELVWRECPEHPNGPPRADPGLLHDIEKYGDSRPTCCVEDCTCGHPPNPES